MWIKICGNTNLQDAQLAAQLGADAVGFVFAASPRQVTPAQVAAISPHLSPVVERVGVFDSPDFDQIARIAIESSLTAVQIHSALDESFTQRLSDRLAGRVRIIQTLHWTVDLPTESPITQLTEQLARVARQAISDRILVDSKAGGATGGTGLSFDWAAARLLFASAPDPLRLIVAGGLNPMNVARAIAQLHPWGVDVSSGVESSPGRKSPELLTQFIANARRSQTQ